MRRAAYGVNTLCDCVALDAEGASGPKERTPRCAGEERPAKAGFRLHYPALLATTGGCGTHLPLPCFSPVLWTVAETHGTPTSWFDSPRKKCAPDSVSRSVVREGA